jgi:hypothetical protein
MGNQPDKKTPFVNVFGGDTLAEATECLVQIGGILRYIAKAGFKAGIDTCRGINPLYRYDDQCNQRLSLRDRVLGTAVVSICTAFVGALSFSAIPSNILPENVKPLQHGTREGVKIVTLAAVASGAFGYFAVGLEAGLDEFRGR